MTGRDRGRPPVVLTRGAALWCLLMALALAAVGCRESSGPTPRDDALVLRAPAPVRVTLQATHVPGLGPIITDGDGRVLYMFPPDARSRVRCVGPCSGTWPTVTIAATGHIVTSRGARPGLVGTLPDPTSGARVVTYRGNPLYRYAGDALPGQTHGQGLFLDGGPWYVLTRSGQPVTSDTTSSRGTG